MILDAIRKVPTATVLLNGDSPLSTSQLFQILYSILVLTGKVQISWLIIIPKESSVLNAKESSNMSIILMQTWVPISVKAVDVNVLI